MFGINGEGFRGNPVGVGGFYSCLPGVARVRATPGYRREPLWGLQRPSSLLECRMKIMNPYAIRSAALWETENL